MKHGDLWVVLFLLGVVVFNWPLLTVIEHSLPFSLFVLWGLFIVALWLLGSRSERDRQR